MKLHQRLVLIGLILISFAGPLDAQDTEPDSPIRAVGTLEAVIPTDLRDLPMSDPFVEFMIDVGADGKLLDILPTRSNHRDLIPAAEQVIDGVEFQPARQDGSPIRARSNIRINFYDPVMRALRQGGTVPALGGTGNDAVAARVFGAKAASYEYNLSKADQLDEPLRILESTQRVYQPDQDIPTAGECLVEFYVGSDGRVHFARALETDSENVAISAALTLDATRFAPPLRSGNPTYVKVRQRFRFQASAGSGETE